MSMIGNFLQITPVKLEELIQDPASVEEFLYPEDGENEEAIDVDKAWHGIHFLLTQKAWEGDPPLGNVVLGGTEIGDDVGYGPARYLTPGEVQAVSDACRDFNLDVFCQRFNREQLSSNDIYPDIWTHEDETDEEQIDYLKTYYEMVVNYYHDAASKGNAMLKYLN